MSASAIGRSARLDRLAGPTGQIAGVAIDHRDSLRATIARAGLRNRSDAELAAFKATVVGLLAPHATVVLIDAELGGEAIASGALGGRSFAMPLEAQGYEEVAAGRATTLLPDFPPATAARAGADACKLLLPYRADHGRSADRQDAVVAKAAAACHEAGLPLVLEPIPYALAGEDAAAFDAAHAGHVLASVERLGALGADVLKLPFPRSTGAEAAGWCERIDASCRETPWVLLGGGGAADDFVRQVEVACRAGASGFIVGRTVWQDAIGLDPEQGARDIAERSVPLVERLAAIASRHGRPLRARLAAPPAPPGWWRS